MIGRLPASAKATAGPPKRYARRRKGRALRPNFSPSRDLQADQRFQERDARPLGVHLDLHAPEPLFRTLLRRFGAQEIDLVGLLRDLREDRDALGLHFRKPERDDEVLLLLALAVSVLASA